MHQCPGDGHESALGAGFHAAEFTFVASRSHNVIVLNGIESAPTPPEASRSALAARREPSGRAGSPFFIGSRIMQFRASRRPIGAAAGPLFCRRRCRHSCLGKQLASASSAAHRPLSAHLVGPGQHTSSTCRPPAAGRPPARAGCAAACGRAAGRHAEPHQQRCSHPPCLPAHGVRKRAHTSSPGRRRRC